MSAFDPGFRIADPSAGTPDRPARTAVAAAVVLHAAIAVWLLMGRDKPPVPEVPVMVATLVQEPKPKPPPAPAAKPPPAPQQLAARSSGPGEETTAPPPAEQRAAENAAPETTEPAPPEPQAPAPATEAPATTAAVAPTPPAEPTREAAETPEKPKRTIAHAQPRKDQLASREPMVPLENRAIGEREETGDPYLNTLWARIEEHRAPTTPIGSSGLHLEGIVTWGMVVDRSGTVEELELVRSSGSTQLDQEARRMILAAAPFPPLPLIYPDRTALKVTIRLFPR